MSIPKGQRRGVRRRRGEQAPRMPGYLKEDLLALFRGDKRGGWGHGWVLHIPQGEPHLLEAHRMWREFAAENPSTPMPHAMASMLIRKYIVCEAHSPGEPTPEDLADVATAAGLTMAEVERRIAKERAD